MFDEVHFNNCCAQSRTCKLETTGRRSTTTGAEGHFGNKRVGSQAPFDICVQVLA